jgi:hypothetical protein
MSSKQLEGILGRATRATPTQPPKASAASPLAQRHPIQEREELLQARIPAGVKKDVLRIAFECGQTLRALLLESLRMNGVSVSDDQL